MKRRILVVCSNVIARAELGMLFGGEYELANALTKDEVMDLLRSFEPELMIIDIDSAGRDVFLILEQATAFNPSLMVVVLTSSYDLDLACELLAKGVCEYVTKPFSPERFASMVKGRVAVTASGRSMQSMSDAPWKIRE